MPFLPRILVALVLAGLSVVAPRPVAGQETPSASEPDITAAFLISFAKFTEWPADALPADAQLRLCVTDPDVGGALSHAVRAHPLVGTHPVSVYLLSETTVPRDCRVLYVSGMDGRRAGPLLAAIGDTSVLTVGDSAAFTDAGGVMYLYIEDGRMRFAVNVAAAERARLRLSSKLLTLARIVGEERR